MTESAVWAEPIVLDELNAFSRETMTAHLGMVFTEVGLDFLRATMPVDSRTVQPLGLLHGGATVALMETLASVAGWCCVDRNRSQCVGIEINANHVRSARSGLVVGTVRPIHLGGKIQVWQADVHGSDDRLVSTGRVTLMVLPR